MAEATFTLRDSHSCLPGYSLGALVSSGSFGWVFHAKQTESHTRAATKNVLEFRDGPAARKRIEQLLSHRSRALAETGPPPEHCRPPGLHVCVCNLSFAGALVLEYAHLGDLSGRIFDMHRCGVGASVQTCAQRYFKHLARAIRHCRDHNIAHLDVKPTNCMLGGADGADILKLADFGSSWDLDYGVAEGSFGRATPELSCISGAGHNRRRARM